jgi:hypothetical protein
MVSFRERLLWLGRMPRHWQVLIGSQFLFTMFALGWRRKLIEQRQREFDAEDDTVEPNYRNSE